MFIRHTRLLDPHVQTLRIQVLNNRGWILAHLFNFYLQISNPNFIEYQI